MLRHFMAHNDSVLCCMNFCIDPIHFILPFNSTGMTAYTVHIHVFPLRLLKRCYTCTQRTQHLTFFFFGGVKFDCDGYILYVCLLSPLITPLFGVFVQSILLSKNIISIIVCCMFDV